MAIQTVEVKIKSTLHCNRCDKSFLAPKKMTRDKFYGQETARTNEFCTCEHCQQTDIHWIYANDLIPEFEGSFEKRREAKRQWLKEN